MKDIVIGGVYKTKEGNLIRIFRGHPYSFMSGRGSTPLRAVPFNHYRADDLVDPTLPEVQNFLAEEMKSGMAKTWNR